MFSYEVQDKDRVIVLAAVGETTFEDYQTVAPQFFADAKSHGIRRLLLDHRQLKGWASEKARSLSFYGWLETRSQFDRIAVVCHDGIRNEMTEFIELVQNVGKDARLFPLGSTKQLWIGSRMTGPAPRPEFQFAQD